MIPSLMKIVRVALVASSTLPSVSPLSLSCDASRGPERPLGQESPRTEAMVRPEAFGAAADGRRDDSVAIQAAIDEVSTRGPAQVWFAPGKTYRIGKPLVLRSHLKLTSGEGQPATIWAPRGERLSRLMSGMAITDLSVSNLRLINDHVPPDDGAGDVLAFGRGCARLSFTGCYFGSSPQGTEGRGGHYHLRGLAFEHENISDIAIRGCTFEWLKYGVLTNSDGDDHRSAKGGVGFILKNVRVLDNRFGNISGDAIEFNHPGGGGLASGFLVRGNTIDVPPGIQADDSSVIISAGFCVGIAGVHDVTVEGNRMRGCRWQGIHVEDGAKTVLIRDNVIEGPGPGMSQGPTHSANLIHILRSDDVQIVGNNLRNAARSAIYIGTDRKQGSNRVLIRSTAIEGGGHIGIYSQSASDVRIESVTIRGFDCGVKIYLEDGQTSIRDTTIRNMAAAGLRTSLAADRFGPLERVTFVGNAKDFDFAAPQLVNGTKIE